MNILIYTLKTGKILRNTICPPSMVDIQTQEGEEWMLGAADDSKNYIMLDEQGIPAITPRPTMSCAADKTAIAADGVDTVTISNIPAGCLVSCDDAFVTVDDGVLEYVTDSIGKHILSFECWPYMEMEVIINAT